MNDIETLEQLVPAMKRRGRPPLPPPIETIEPSKWSLYGKMGGRMFDAKASEAEVRTEFTEMPLPEALELLAVCRKNIEIAAKIINQRITAPSDNERCTGCGGPPKKRDPQRGTPLWIMQGSRLNANTGLEEPYRFCDVFCVRERNKTVLLPKGHSGAGVDGRDLGDIK